MARFFHQYFSRLRMYMIHHKLIQRKRVVTLTMHQPSLVHGDLSRASHYMHEQNASAASTATSASSKVALLWPKATTTPSSVTVSTNSFTPLRSGANAIFLIIPPEASCHSWNVSRSGSPK